MESFLASALLFLFVSIFFKKKGKNYLFFKNNF